MSKTLSKILVPISLASLLSHLYISFFLKTSCSWNTGVMLGLVDFLNPVFLVFLMLFVLFFTSFLLWKSYPEYRAILVVLIISSLGNILDRAFHGAVCDYISLEFFIKLPVFNLNDIFISISLLFLLIIIFYEGVYCKKTGK